MSTERIEAELVLIRRYYSTAEVQSGSGLTWVRIPGFKLPRDVGWNKEQTDVAFNFPSGYPGAAPYGIYIPTGLFINNNINILSGPQYPPPFEGIWGMISWAPEAWMPMSNLVQGSNMLNFLNSFIDRFKQGV